MFYNKPIRAYPIRFDADCISQSNQLIRDLHAPPNVCFCSAYNDLIEATLLAIT